MKPTKKKKFSGIMWVASSWEKDFKTGYQVSLYPDKARKDEMKVKITVEEI
jgi:hypothetical protein